MVAHGCSEGGAAGAAAGENRCGSAGAVCDDGVPCRAVERLRCAPRCGCGSFSGRDRSRARGRRALVGGFGTTGGAAQPGSCEYRRQRPDGVGRAGRAGGCGTVRALGGEDRRGGDQRTLLDGCLWRARSGARVAGPVRAGWSARARDHRGPWRRSLSADGASARAARPSVLADRSPLIGDRVLFDSDGAAI